MKLKTLLGGIVAASLGLAAALPLQAQTLGKEYLELNPPQATDNQAKIEVVEFFSYGCIHCYRLHPHIKKWAAGAAKDVDFKRIPVTFDRPAMVPMAKLFYTLEATGDMARLDDLVFKAVHDENVNMATDKAVLEWVAKQGVDVKKFTDTYNSFGIQSKVQRASQLTKAFRVAGTPAVYVNGRYAIRNEGMSGYDQIMVVAGQLVDKTRAEKGKKK
jgi:protein dithiol oxidoreductase (disulfide-forming)